VLKRATSELIDAMGKQAALVKRAHLAALVCVAGGLRKQIGCTADAVLVLDKVGTDRFKLCEKKQNLFLIKSSTRVDAISCASQSEALR
jgi:hypothetical protein